ncbi:subclass B1 metallo-beta-lactamase [Hirschia litorea]|uniref:beta-lactamase n=1 Tax=Hirschia litorea TaxID=1199156 RepID=A0ABW2IN65_9PROT
MRPTLIGIFLFSSLVFLSGCTHNAPVFSQQSEQTTQTDGVEEKPVEFVKLATGVWLHTGYKVVPPWGNIRTNGLIIERNDYSVLIDTAWNDAQTAEIVSWAKDTLKKPVRASIHTHAHSDKMGGMDALHAQGVETYASALTNRLAIERGLLPAKNVLELADIGSQVEWEGLTVLYPGGGHSEDNIVVNEGENNILFGGCMIRPGMTTSLGNTGDANLGYWSRAVENATNAFPDSQIVIPSHGKPAGREILKNTAYIARPKVD